MDSIDVHTETRESSPLTTPPASTPGTSPRMSSRANPMAEDPSKSEGQPSLVVKTRASKRLAAQHAQQAIKRSMQDLDADTSGEPSKRARLRAPAAREDAESSCTEESGVSQSTVDSADVCGKGPMEAIIASMAGDAQSSVTKVTADGPPSSGKPLVWANGRGSLCEALPYFKAYKGSLHSASLVAQGFLVDQEVDPRDVFGAQVIICSV